MSLDWTGTTHIQQCMYVCMYDTYIHTYLLQIQ